MSEFAIYLGLSPKVAHMAIPDSKMSIERYCI